MVRFVIIRHGRSLYNEENRYTGQTDIPLAALGLKQAEQTADYILKHYQISSIYSSDLKRAMDTAAPVARALGLPIHPMQALREVYAGLWEGMRNEDVLAQYGKELAAYLEDPSVNRCGGGENAPEVIARCKAALLQIAKENPGKTVLIATHGAALRAMMCLWDGLHPSQMNRVGFCSNASITEVEYDAALNSFRLIQWGFTEHLQQNVTHSIAE